MGHAHEDEGAEQQVERGAAGDQDQDALGVGSQPDVILADEQLVETARRRRLIIFGFLSYIQSVLYTFP